VGSWPRGEVYVHDCGSVFRLKAGRETDLKAGNPTRGRRPGEPGMCLTPVKPTLCSFFQTLHIVQYVGDTALPRLRKFLVDNDRVLTVCTNIMYYIVSPALKIKSRYWTPI
jgi:hypothetical protein